MNAAVACAQKPFCSHLIECTFDELVPRSLKYETTTYQTSALLALGDPHGKYLGAPKDCFYVFFPARRGATQSRHDTCPSVRTG